MEIQTAVDALAALAQETRLAAYRLLVQAGSEGLAAGRIADALAVSPATLSFHLKELAHAGLIASRNDSRYVIYRADYAAMNGLMAYLTEHCCQGAACGPKPVCCPDPKNPLETAA
ncbi:MAG: metalloregulator ArsR/SmtB family transcription factor [Pseudomonadota bacterium]